MDFSSIITDQRIQTLIADGLARVLRESLSAEVSIVEFKIKEEKSEFKLKTFGLLRYFFNKKTNCLFVGSSDESSVQFFKSMENNKLIELETSLIKSLNESISEQVKSINYNTEIKSTLIAPEDQLGIFNLIDVCQSFQIKLSINSKIVHIEIPLTSKAYLPSALLEQSGFSDQSKILIVDDSKLVRYILKNYLFAAGFLYVEEANDGKEALLKIKKAVNNYNLIIADWHMPEMSGLELLREVRMNSATKSTPFILATAEQKKEEIIEAVKLKVSGYVVKPYSAELLFKSIKSVAEKSR